MRPLLILILAGAASLTALNGWGAEPPKEEAAKWWNEEWTVRTPITVDGGADGGAIGGTLDGGAAMLLRLHDGNFQFALARQDGTDLRFVSEDGTVEFPYHIEKFDPLLNEAFVWVRVPSIADGKVRFWIYYGNAGEAVENVQDPAATYDEATVVVYHFASQPPVDSSAGGNNAEAGGAAVQGAMIGAGLRLDGQTSVRVPTSPTIGWTAGGGATWMAWVKPVVDQPRTVLFSRREGGSEFIVGMEAGVPFLQISGGGSTQKTAPGAPIAAGTWKHLATVSDGGAATLYVDGVPYGTISISLPALNSDLMIGGDTAAGDIQFIGELDELHVRTAASSPQEVKLAAVNQGGTAAAEKLLQFGETEQEGGGGGHNEALEHVMLFGDIAKNMMFDGWIAVGVCVLMILTGWTVAVQKFNYLNSIQKGTDVFMKQWAKVSTDLTVLDKAEGKGLAGILDNKTYKLIRKSPVYHLYHIGSEEIQHRVGNGKDRSKGLSARSIQAIRASLETGLVRENQRMNSGLIFLTISIAGGPYVGLLGTVVGVMITFAIIAKSGEVDVNSIAPGIASALLATVAGLIVAIPALFIYSYLSSRIKDLLASMQVFIDEFIAKMAEFYPTPGEGAVPVPAPPEPIATGAAHEDVAATSRH